jgi:hypothetical protein
MTIADPVRLGVAQLDAWEPKSAALIACQIRNEHGAWIDFTYEAVRKVNGTWRVDIGRRCFEHFPSWDTFTAWLRQRGPRDIELILE